MTDAIELEEVRVRELALPASEMRRADKSIRKTPDDESGDVAQRAESCADSIERRIAGHEAPGKRPRSFARRAVRKLFDSLTAGERSAAVNIRNLFDPRWPTSQVIHERPQRDSARRRSTRH
jgi:hypothetical protein